MMSVHWKMDDQWLEYTAVQEDSGLLLEQLLKERLHISGRMIQRLTRNKGLFLNRRVPFLKKKVKNGDRIKMRIGDGTKEPPLQPVHLPLDLLFEDDALMVLNKQPGLMVHPVKEGQNQTLAHGIAFYRLQKGKSGFVRPVHRLDKETSGAILFAGNGYIHRLLDQQLGEGIIKRSYFAVVAGQLGAPGEKGVINAPIGRDPFHPTRRQVKEEGEKAITRYEIKESYPSGTLVEVQLETGRTHQIRVHFSHLGHPLLGDSLYGGESSLIKRQALHAHQLVLIHPVTGQPLECKAPLPEDMEQLILHLNNTQGDNSWLNN